MTSPSRCEGLGLVDHGLVEVWIEVCAERLDRSDAAFAQEIEHLLVDQLDALRSGSRIR